MKIKSFIVLLFFVTNAWILYAEKVEINKLCYNLDAIHHEAEVTFKGTKSHNSYAGLTAAIIPETIEYNSITYDVTSIGGGAFDYCSDLTIVTIPNSIKGIGDYAFIYCTGLTSIEIPGSVINFGEWIFYGCSGLTSVDISDGITIIPHAFLYDCTALTSVNIPNSVTVIDDNAFDGCTNLPSIEIPEGVISIGGDAFHDCDALSTVIIPNSVTSLGEDAFCDCANLTSVTIGAGVTNIEEGAFWGCINLINVTCKAITPPTCASDAFHDVNPSISFYVPSESIEAYSADGIWQTYNDKIQPISDTAIDDIINCQSTRQKLLHNGQIYILCDGEVFDLTGRKL